MRCFVCRVNEVEKALVSSAPGLFNFYQVTVRMLRHFSTPENKMKFAGERIRNNQTAVKQCKRCFEEEHPSTADSYYELGVTQHELGDFNSALESQQRALDIRLKLFGEDHPSTEDSHHSLGITHHELGDFHSALESKQRALDIQRKRFGEGHLRTAESYHSLGVTHYD